MTQCAFGGVFGVGRRNGFRSGVGAGKDAGKNEIGLPRRRQPGWPAGPHSSLEIRGPAADCGVMATGTREVLLYDDSCPMCRLYSHAFVRSGVLGKGGRLAFSEVPPELARLLDPERARREIPLVDRESGAVRYGIDALFHLIGARWRVFKPLLDARWFRAAWQPVYLFISYNRRMIAGVAPSRCAVDCSPRFHAGWWAALMTLAAVVAWLGLAGVPMRLSAGPWLIAAFLAPVALWWAVLAARSASLATALQAAGHAANSLSHASLVLLIGRLSGGPAAAWGFSAVAWILLLHELWRRRWLFRAC